jgi:putative oxidoreductase
MKNLNGLVILRLVLGFIFLTHSWYRLYYGTVGDFGNVFLGKVVGFGVLGLPMAWTVTILESVCAGLLFANLWVRIVSFWLIFQILLGIYLVHLPSGWFVVGAGRNGIEYSVLVLASLLAIAFPNGFLKSNKMKKD